MASEFRTAYLADHPEALSLLATWFEEAWPEWYGPGGAGHAEEDLARYAGRAQLPIGVVGFSNGALVGIAVLKDESVSSRRDLRPWAAAGLIHPVYRRRGFGAKLIAALEDVARDAGFGRIYCGTATAATLLERCGWTFLEHSSSHGDEVDIYEKMLISSSEGQRIHH